MTHQPPSEFTIERYALDIVSMSPTATGYLRSFFSRHLAALDALRGTPAFSRLDGIRQLGLKRGTKGVPATMVPFCGGMESATTDLEPFTRRAHSERMCATAVACSALHDVPFEDAFHAAVAALLHDIGHPAFSHTVEPILRRHGFPDHEEAGQALMREDPSIRAAFARFGVDAERVVAIARERGDLGLRQSLCDTLTYLTHDTRVVGRPLGEPYVWDVLRSVRSVRDGAFDVEDPSLLQGFLETRFAMTVEMYEHPYNRVNSLLVCEIVDWLVAGGHLDVAALATLRDAEVLRALARAAVGQTPAWVGSATRLLTSSPAETRQWAFAEHETEEIALAAVRASAPGRPVFLLSPIDFTRKSFPIRLPDGTRQDVRVPPTARPRNHRVWHTVAYAGPI